MRKLLLLLVLCGAAFGQGVRFDLPPVLNSRGVPIANPQISLCTGAAVINGTTCSIQATGFTDITLATPCAGGSPVTLANSNVCRATGDALGNAGFWLTPGAYIYCVTAPSTTGQCYNLIAPVGATAGGTATITGALTAQSVNSVLWVGGTSGYATLSACYTALPSTGGTCMVIPNYSETLSANLVLSKNNAGFLFMGPATITMGTNQVTKAGTVFGAFIKGTAPWAGSSGAGQLGAVFIYSGTSDAFLIGDTTNATIGFEMSNILIEPGTAGSAIHLKAVAQYRLDNITIAGPGGSATTTGIIYDSGSTFATSDSTTIAPRIYSLKIGLQFTGAALNAGNNNTVIGPQFGFLTAGGICVDFEQQATGNIVENVDCESQPTAINFGGSSNNNRVSLWHSGNTTDVAAGASTQGNVVDFIGPWGVAPVISDSGTNNTILWTKNYKQDVNGNYTTNGNVAAGSTNGGQAIAGLQSISPSAQAGISWKAGVSAVDNKWWDCLAGNAVFNCRAVNDANNAANSWVSVGRSGAAITTVQFPVIGTLTNCNVNSVSPAACGSAPSGVVVVPTTTTTYTVSTTAVTANSRIQVWPITDNSGVSGAPTCNAPPTPFIGYESGRTAGVSFTFTLPSTTGTSCWDYAIVN